MRAARSLPEVPELALSMARLHKRCEEAAARTTGHPVDVKLQEAGALKSGETVDLGTGEIQPINGSGVDQSSRSLRKQAEVPGADPVAVAAPIQSKAPPVSGETTSRLDERTGAAAQVRPTTAPPLEWQSPIEGNDSLLTKCGRYCCYRKGEGEARRYTIWRLVPHTWFTQVGEPVSTFAEARRLAQQDAEKQR